MKKSTTHSAKAALRTLLALALVLSLFCMSALAANVPDYAHLEVGTASTTALKVGDTVKIPVSLKGLKQGQYLSGFSCNVAAASDGYLTVTGIEFASGISGWSGGYNSEHGSVNMVNLAFAEHPEDCLYSDGLLFRVVCRVEKDITAGTSTGIALSSVSMSQSSTFFLNSPDGTEEKLDRSAVVYPTDANGNPNGGISVPEKAAFTMTVTADKTSVEADGIVTVTITGNGGTFAGAAYDMTYDPSLFELVSKPDDVAQSGSTFSYMGVFTGAGMADGADISTFTFKALAQDAEVEGEFTLVPGECYIETLDSSIGGNAEPCEISAPAKVKITLKGGLTVSAPDVTVDYDGNAYGVTATANIAGAAITYADASGNYTLSASPEYTAVGEYTVRFRATLKGYAPAYGQAKVTINQPKYFTETREYVAGYTLVLVYTDYDTTRYTYAGNTMMDVTAAGYTRDDVKYEHVYGWVVKGSADLSKIAYTADAATAVEYSTDVNASGTTDLRDAVAAVGVYNADETRYMLDSNMAMILRADVNHDKTVDGKDYSAVLAAIK